MMSSMMNPTALVAMSGGVDSSVAALLLTQAGCRCTGAMMKLFDNEDVGAPREKSCCSLEDAMYARSVAARLNIPFYVFNFAGDFRSQVVRRFIEAYENGATPNPCIDCNRYLKFDRFLHRAAEMGCDFVATGHYARIEQDPVGGRWLLKKGIDPSKDQSYVLYAMTQAQLARTRFPLGYLKKSQVREIALEYKFANAQKQDSQDICFVPKGHYAEFIEEYTGRPAPKGRFKDMAGRDLGEHKGIIHYTVGQRKKLGIPLPEPLYVCSVDAPANTVILGESCDLYKKTLVANDINLIPVDRLDGPLRVQAKIRYGQPAQPATLRQLDADILLLEFDAPQRAVTKGQAAVFYDGDLVIGGGTISGAAYLQRPAGGVGKGA
jgi:tRNA-specific 2-thiouridylase